MESTVIILLIILGFVLCVMFLVMGLSAFSAKGMCWSRAKQIYTRGPKTKALGILFISIAAAGIGKALHFEITRHAAYNRNRAAAAPKQYAPPPQLTANIPAGAHVDSSAGFFIVPPPDYVWEGNFMGEVVARFKEKLDGPEIEHHVVITREFKSIYGSLSAAYAEYQTLHDSKIIETFDDKLGPFPCLRIVHTDDWNTINHCFLYMDDDSLWTITCWGHPDRFEDARAALEKSARSFRTFAMANEEAEKAKKTKKTKP